MDLLTAVVVLFIAAALIGWVAAAVDGRPLEAFGAGFVGYRAHGWPHGVQEEDSVHFAPTAWHEHSPVDDEGQRSLTDPEIIELDASAGSPVPLQRLR